jgi:tRNA (adenine57-N1/adenine58-N1)-methyltransferase catalytic subunit
MAHEKRKQERRRLQMKVAREKAKSKKSKIAEVADKNGFSDPAAASNRGVKRKDFDHRISSKPEDDGRDNGDDATLPPSDHHSPGITMSSEPHAEYGIPSMTRPVSEMRGHTSYLTFASMYPQDIRDQMNQQFRANGQLTLSESAQNGDIHDQTGSEYGDNDLEEAMGALTEEEIIGMTA